jgi:hypothetical protein
MFLYRGVSLKVKDRLMRADLMEIIEYHNLQGIPVEGLM